jgi:hypothetical protein
MNLYCDLVTLKSSSVADFASVTTHDTFLLVLLEAASRAVDEFCNRHFFVKTTTNYFDGAKVLLLHRDLLTVTTLKTDADGDQTFENTFATTDYNLYPLNEIAKRSIELSYNSNYSSFAYGIPKGVQVVGLWGYGDGLSVTPYSDSGAVVNTGGMTSGATTHALATGKGALFAVGQTILIDTEQCYVSGISTDTLTLTRGVNGTTAASHLAAAVIYIYKYPKAITIATIMQTLRWWKRRESAFQTSVQTEIGSINVYRGVDPDISVICQQYRILNS